MMEFMLFLSSSERLIKSGKSFQESVPLLVENIFCPFFVCCFVCSTWLSSWLSEITMLIFWNPCNLDAYFWHPLHLYPLLKYANSLVHKTLCSKKEYSVTDTFYNLIKLQYAYWSFVDTGKLLYQFSETFKT